MKDGKKVLVSDLDGTLISFSLSSKLQHIILRYKVYPLLLLLFLPLYLMRIRKKTSKEMILEVKRQGGRIILFSATKNFFLSKEIIKLWLLLWGVPYDKIILRPKGEGVKEFKYRILREEKADVLLENELPIVGYVVKRFLSAGSAGMRIIDIIWENGYSIICFSTFNPYQGIKTFGQKLSEI